MAFPLSVLRLKTPESLRILKSEEKKNYGRDPTRIVLTQIENIRKLGILVDEPFLDYLLRNINVLFRNSVPVIILTLKLMQKERINQDYQEFPEYRNLVEYIARKKLSDIEYKYFLTKLGIQILAYKEKLMSILPLPLF